MAEDRSYLEKIASGAAPAPIKDLLAELVGEVESLYPLLKKNPRRNAQFMIERLVDETVNPNMEMHVWEVALDLIAKAGAEAGEPGGRVEAILSRLSPELHGFFETPGEVTLQEVTEENVFGIIMLSETLSEPKSNFVAPNAISLAQALVSKHAWYRAIYAGKTLAGFLMMYDNPEEPRYFLWRFMIAEPFHGRGYGRQAIQRLIEHVRARPGATELLLSCGEGEGSPEGFYARQGFTRTGERLGHEIVMRIPL